MSSYPSDFGWYTPGVWANGHNRMTGASQIVPNPLNHSSHFSMYQEKGFQSVDPLPFDYAAQPSPALLNPGYTVPSAGPQAGLGSLGWLADETPLDYTSSGDNGTAGLRTRHLNHHASIDSPMRSNIGPSVQEPHMPMAGTNASSREQTAHPRASKTSDRVRHAGAIKCEWKGCMYAGVFSRKAELKRHVETQHIFPNSYECPERKCKKSFNRRDNLEQHLRRAHFWNCN